jgi:protocatechuate 3,4-dioxygenase beta subunit
VQAPPPQGPSRPFAGEVIDLAGYPVAGAAVVAGGALAQSAEDGRFELVAPPGVATAQVWAPGFRTARVPLVAASLRAVLTPVGTIGGAVRGGAHAVVRLAGSGVWPPRSTHADRLGRYAFDDVPEGVYELDAAGEGFAASLITAVSVDGPGGAATADLEARPAALLTGKAPAGARVTLTPSRFSLLGHDALADATGTYRIAGVAPGRYRLRAEAPGFAAFPLALVDVTAPATRFDIALARGARLEGRVLTHDGAPAAGARIEVRVEGAEGPVTISGTLHRARGAVASARSGTPLPVGPASAFTTDAQGRFAVAGLPAGRSRIVAFHPRSAPAASEAVDLGEEETGRVSLVLAPPCALAGRVLDEIGSSVDGARVVVSFPGRPFPRRVLQAGEGGRFHLRRLPPGEARLVASAPDLAPAHLGIRLRTGAEREVELRLARSGLTIEGLVVGPDRDPLSGARISIAPRDRGGPTKTALSDEVGHFRVEGLPPGAYVVRAEHADHPPVTLEGVDGSEALEIRLGGGGEILGRVADARGDPFLGARVRAERRPEPGERGRLFVVERPVAEDGRYRLAGLPPGRYALTVRGPDLAPIAREGVEVREADRLEIDFEGQRTRSGDER